MAGRFESSDQKVDRNFSEQEKKRLGLLLEKYSENAPQPSDFSDTYSAQEIARDELDLAKAKTEHKRTPEEREVYFYSKVLELAMDTFSDAWLPSVLCRVSEYDDVKRGTDGLLEANSDKTGQVLRLLIDITSGVEEVDKKLAAIENNLRNGNLQLIKYYDSELGQIEPGKHYLKTIIGAGRGQVVELGRLMLNYQVVTQEIKTHNQKNNSDRTVITALTEKKKRIFDHIKAHPLASDISLAIKLQLMHSINTLSALGKAERPKDIHQQIEELKEWLEIIRRHERTLTPKADKGYFNPVQNRLLDNFRDLLGNPANVS